MIKRKLLVGCCLTIGLMLAGCGDKEVSNQSATTTQVETTTEAETTTEVETTTEEETSTKEEVTTGVEDETTEAPTEPVTEASTESITEAVKPTEAPTQKPTEAPTTKPVETQAPTKAPTQAPVVTPTTPYVFEEPEIAQPKAYDYKEDQAVFRQRVAEDYNEEELVKLAAEGKDLRPIIFTSSDAWREVVFWDVPDEEAWEIVYSSGVDWKEHAYNVAMYRWGTADGFDEAYVRYYLEYFGFSKEEAEYGASKWAENPPYETAIDWFEMAKRCATIMGTDLSDEQWIGVCIGTFSFTKDEAEYGVQFRQK